MSDLPAPQNAAKAMGDWIARTSTAMLADILGAEAAREPAARVALALRSMMAISPAIQQCSRESIAQAVAMCALTGLVVGGPAPDAYVLPRQIRGSWQLQWQISYRGLVRLARRAGSSLAFVVVREGDTLTAQDGGPLDELAALPPRLTRGAGTAGAMLGVVVVARNAQGHGPWLWVAAETIYARRAVSDAWKRGESTGKHDSPWHTWPEEMAIKTALKYFLSRGLVDMDDTMQRALATDSRQIIDIEAPATPVATVRPQPLLGTAALDDALSWTPEPEEAQAILAAEKAEAGK